MITARKLKLAIVSENKNESYEFLKREMYLQYKALNFAYQHLIFERIGQDKIKSINEEYQQHIAKYKASESEKYALYQSLVLAPNKDEKYQKKLEKAKSEYEKAKNKVLEIERKYSKESSETFQNAVGLAKQTRLGKLIKSEFDLHYDTVDRIVSTVIANFSTDLKNGVLSGERNYRHYKKTNPLYVRARSMKVYEEDGEYYVSWVKGIIFKIILKNGSKQKENINELKTTLSRIVDGQYKMCDSSILYDKNRNLILNLTLDIPVAKENNFIPNRVVGVDLGLKIPAYVSLNDVPYIRKAIGNIRTSLKIKSQLQNQRKKEELLLHEIREEMQKEKMELSKDLRNSKGGKGRNKKLKTLERYKQRERNFIKTHNHTISKNIIDFALKNHAGVIHMEKLDFDKMENKYLLRNWSYYELQKMVEYKAEREGIVVYYVDASYTSQTCSKCGNLEEGQRTSQEKFTCKSCGFSANADYNASQNIAKSEIDEAQIQKKQEKIKKKEVNDREKELQTSQKKDENVQMELEI